MKHQRATTLHKIFQIFIWFMISSTAYAQELKCDKIKKPGNSFLERMEHAQ